MVNVMQWAASAVGISSSVVNTHSLRAGGTTALFASGVDWIAIQRWGRWRSFIFHEYVWHDSMAFLHLGERIASTRGLNTLLVDVAPLHVRDPKDTTLPFHTGGFAHGGLNHYECLLSVLRPLSYMSLMVQLRLNHKGRLDSPPVAGVVFFLSAPSSQFLWNRVGSNFRITGCSVISNSIGVPTSGPFLRFIFLVLCTYHSCFFSAQFINFTSLYSSNCLFLLFPPFSTILIGNSLTIHLITFIRANNFWLLVTSRIGVFELSHAPFANAFDLVLRFNLLSYWDLYVSLNGPWWMFGESLVVFHRACGGNCEFEVTYNNTRSFRIALGGGRASQFFIWCRLTRPVLQDTGSLLIHSHNELGLVPSFHFVSRIVLIGSLEYILHIPISVRGSRGSGFCFFISSWHYILVLERLITWGQTTLPTFSHSPGEIFGVQSFYLLSSLINTDDCAMVLPDMNSPAHIPDELEATLEAFMEEPLLMRVKEEILEESPPMRVKEEFSEEPLLAILDKDQDYVGPEPFIRSVPPTCTSHW